jgi:hypothetical protein
MLCKLTKKWLVTVMHHCFVALVNVIIIIVFMELNSSNSIIIITITMVCCT